MKPRLNPRQLLPVVVSLALLMTLFTAGSLWLRSSQGDTRGPVSTETPPTASTTPEVARGPREALAQWDERRAIAWADGDAVALRRLYTPGSAAGRADVAALRKWTDRGLRVEGLTTQVLEATVLRATNRRITIRVTDRVIGGTATGNGVRESLPTDQSSTREVTLVRSRSTWLMTDVRDV